MKNVEIYGSKITWMKIIKEFYKVDFRNSSVIWYEDHINMYVGNFLNEFN